MSVPHSLLPDLDYIVGRCGPVWETLRGARLFITGGTGFYGTWLVESLARAEETLNLGIEAVLLSRSPDRFLERNPYLRGRPCLKLVQGDVRDFAFPDGEFSHVVHAATEASEALNNENPLLMIDTIVEGTRRALDLAARAKARRFLNLSSGAVYGNLPPGTGPVPEDFAGAPDLGEPKWAYGEGKRLAELLGSIYAQQTGMASVSARCFATAGPRLALDIHFAIGNFIGDALAGRDLVVKGDGTPVRSYIDVADLTVWLWHLLAFGKTRTAYNVGSEQGYSIAELARLVGQTLAPHLPVRILGQPIPQQLASLYLPSTLKARTELGLETGLSLESSIRRTAAWARAA